MNLPLSQAYIHERYDLATFKSYPHLRKPMSSAFNIAWSLLKALPEYQSYQERYEPTYARYDQPTQVLQRRRGTLPPAIARIMRETQEGRQLPRSPFPMDTRIRNEFEIVPQGRLQEYSIYPMDAYDTAPTSGYEESGEYDNRYAQMQRGSLFDQRPVRFSSMIEHPPKQPLDPNAVAAYLQFSSYMPA